MPAPANTPVIWSANDILANYDSLGVPHFQRGLVWGTDSVALLLESLFFETPCGLLLLWEPLEPGKMGAALPGAGATRRFVLDGQQRIRSLWKAFCATDEDVDEGDEDDERDSGGGRKTWCLYLPRLAQVAEDFPEILQDRSDRFDLFRFVTDPMLPEARLKRNLVPLSLLFDRRDEQAEQLLHAGSRTRDLVQRVRDIGLADRVRRMRSHPLFAVRTLVESNGRNGLAGMVELYNRINSGGKRVDAEEKAFATLVALAPDTGAWLGRVFDDLQGRSGRVAVTSARDDVLQRRKERNFGFKLIIRTFVQVCSYHFGYSLGSTGLSFAVVESGDFRRDLRKAGDAGAMLRERTREILVFLRSEVLAGALFCDDLQMLPDTTTLLPVIQVLVRFPGLMRDPSGPTRVASLALRLMLGPPVSQKASLDLVDLVNRSRTASACLELLDRSSACRLDPARFRKALEQASSLNDRHVLLLYWLERRNRAKDLLYSQVPEERRQKLFRELENAAGGRLTEEVEISEKFEPQKQHLVPYHLLERLFDLKARGRVTRHEANNIGHVTYISRALNHYETGLGGDRTRLEEEPSDNLARHLLKGEDAPGLIEAFMAACQEPPEDKAASRAAFASFCRKRRELIARGFENWIEELRGLPSLDTRIEPDTRVKRMHEDWVREAGFPDELEDVLIGCVDTGLFRQNDADAERYGPVAVRVMEPSKRKRAFVVALRRDLGRVDVIGSSHAFFREFRACLETAGESLLRAPAPDGDMASSEWWLDAREGRCEGTVRVFQSLGKLLAREG